MHEGCDSRISAYGTAGEFGMGVAKLRACPIFAFDLAPSARNRRTHMPARRAGSRCGFAVILALLLVSFLVLLLAALSMLSRVEIQAGDRASAQALARAHALFALQQALGELAQAAGPDTRVTARAESVGREGEVPHPLTPGLWDTRNPGAAPRWLVSGISGDAADADPVRLWARGVESVPRSDGSGTYPAVEAPAVDILLRRNLATDNPGDRRAAALAAGAGLAAWWIDDEGLKASVAVPDLVEHIAVDPAMPENFASAYRARYRQHLPASPSLAHLGLPAPERFEPGDREDLRSGDHLRHARRQMRTGSLEEFAAAFDANWSAAAENPSSSPVHLTPLALGVLADTARGGLRADLSALGTPGVSASAFAGAGGDARINDDLQAYIQYRGNPAAGARLRPGAPSQGPGTPSFSIEPVITEFVFNAGLAASSSSGQLTLFYYVFAEFWNPFSHTVQTTGRNNPDYRIRVRSLPNATVTIWPKSSDPANPTESPVYSATLALPPIDAELDIFNPLRPGQVLMATTPSGSGGTAGNGTWHLPLAAAIPAGVDREFPALVQFSQAEVVVELYDVGAGANRLIRSFVLGGYDAFEVVYPTDFVRAPGGTGVRAMSRQAISTPDIAVAYHFRIYDEVVPLPEGLSELERLLVRLNLGTPAHAILPEGDDPDALYGITFRNPNLFSRSDTFLATDFFADRLAVVGSGPDRVARVRDLPTLPLVSVGDLRFMDFSEAQSNRLGRAGSGAPNDWFDRFFFSGEDPAVADAAQARPPNHRLLQFAPDTGSGNFSESGARYLVRGGFNLNSPSGVAWATVLQGLTVPEFRSTFETGSATATRDLHRAFFGLPFAAHHSLEYSPGSSVYRFHDATEQQNLLRSAMNGLVTNRTHPAFTQGVRELTDAQVASLAAEVATQVRNELSTRGRPFDSIEDFIESAALERALANSGINGDAQDRIPIGSPARIDQETVMAQLAPVLSARSDTFRIRFYGDVRNPVTGEVSGRAHGEARVQRMPELIEQGSENRRFQIVSFRWLSPDEI